MSDTERKISDYKAKLRKLNRQGFAQEPSEMAVDLICNMILPTLSDVVDSLLREAADRAELLKFTDPKAREAVASILDSHAQMMASRMNTFVEVLGYLLNSIAEIRGQRARMEQNAYHLDLLVATGLTGEYERALAAELVEELLMMLDSTEDHQEDAAKQIAQLLTKLKQLPGRDGDL